MSRLVVREIETRKESVRLGKWVKGNERAWSARGEIEKGRRQRQTGKGREREFCTSYTTLEALLYMGH